MSNIQGPSQNQGANAYGAGGYAGGAQGYGANPLAQYGMQNEQTQAYIEQMHRYQQMLMSYKKMYPNDAEMIATIDSYMATSQKYLQQVGDTSSAWDPMGGMMGDDFGMGGGMGGMDPMGGMGGMSAGGGVAGEVIWADRNRVKYDGSELADVMVGVNESDKRQKEFFQENFTLRVPFHGSGKMELLDDDSSAPPAKMLKISVTMPDGSSRIYIKHNVKETDQIRILTADGEAAKFVQDAALTSSPVAAAIAFGKIGEDDPLAQAGDAQIRRMPRPTHAPGIRRIPWITWPPKASSSTRSMPTK